METQLSIEQRQYIDFKVYSVTPIKKKYGFRVVLIYEDGEKKIQKSGFKTKKEANAARNIVITELHNGTFIVNNSFKVREFFTYWLEEYMKPNKLTADSYDSYKNIVYNHIMPSFGNIDMTTLNRGHIQKLYNEKASLSHNIARLCKAVMNSALKYALEKKFISVNVAKDVNLPKCIKKKKYRTIEIDTKKH